MLLSEDNCPYSTAAENSVLYRMSKERGYHQEKETLMKSIGNERDVETSHLSTSDINEIGSTIATTNDIPSNNGLSEDNPNNYNHPDDRTDSMPPLYEPKPGEASRERPKIQFQDLLKADVLLQPYYWTCISPTRYGQRCRVVLPKENIQLAQRKIISLHAEFPNDIPSEAELMELSNLLLCNKYHRSQAAEIAMAWKKDLSVSFQQDTTTVNKDITPIYISDQFLPFPSRQPNSIISAITAAMRKPLSPLDHAYGTIYVFSRPGTPSMVKIGSTSKNVLHRLQEYSRNCHFKPNLISQRSVRHYHRAEKLIHHSLMEHRRYELSCNAGNGCNFFHQEWLEIDSTRATLNVERWTSWMNLNPYVSDRLDAFWEFNLFEAEQLPNLDAFHQWIEHMTKSCIDKGEECWRGRRDGKFKNRSENVVNEAQLSHAPSLVSASSLSSSLSIDQRTRTAEKFVTWLLQDEVIQSLHVIAIDRIGARDFESSFRQFLHIYSKDLQAEACTASELQAAQFVGESGWIVASCLRRQLKLETKEDSRNFQTLLTHEPDKDELMKRFVLSKTPMQMSAFNTNFHSFKSPAIIQGVDNQSTNSTGWYDNELDNIGQCDFDLDDIERDDSEDGDADIPSLPNLGLVREFMIASESFVKLRQNLKNLIFPPKQHILKGLVGTETPQLVSSYLAEESVPSASPISRD